MTDGHLEFGIAHITLLLILLNQSSTTGITVIYSVVTGRLLPLLPLLPKHVRLPTTPRITLMPPSSSADGGLSVLWMVFLFWWW